MPYRADKIIGNIYQGPKPPTGEALKNAGVNVLVLCAKEIVEEFRETGVTFPDVHVIYAPSNDDYYNPPQEEWKRDWIAAAKEISQRAKSGQKVLVTCYAGLNRSGVVSALAAHFLTGRDAQSCIDLVRMSREGALQNPMFVKWLRSYCVPAKV